MSKLTELFGRSKEAPDHVSSAGNDVWEGLGHEAGGEKWSEDGVLLGMEWSAASSVSSEGGDGVVIQETGLKNDVIVVCLAGFCFCA